MRYILETERLRLREFRLEDGPFIVELLNSPGWIRYIGDRNVRTVRQAEAYLENGPIKSYKENGYGLFLVETRDDGVPIGMCGILKRETLEHPDIGFAFLAGYNGMGYAFEIASATLRYAKDALGIQKVSGITAAENFKSIRLLERIGLTYHRRFSFPGGNEELLLYSN
ncbi:MAG TPA: GNAT family N-acetyltransferase [Chryseosolibacter sp.]